MSTHRLPKSESSVAAPSVKPGSLRLIDLAARFLTRGWSWGKISEWLCVPLTTLNEWRDLPDFAQACVQETERILIRRGALELAEPKVVAGDAALMAGGLASSEAVRVGWACVSADLTADVTHDLKSHLGVVADGVSATEVVAKAIERERRRAEFGPGYARRFKNLELSLDAPRAASDTLTLESVLPDERHPGRDPLASILQIEARLEADALLARAEFEPREAQVVAYVLAQLGGEPEHGDLAALAREWGLKPTTVYGYWHKAKEKLRRVSPA